MAVRSASKQSKAVEVEPVPAAPAESESSGASPESIAGHVEALICSSERPISRSQLVEALTASPDLAPIGAIDAAAVVRAVEHLNSAYEQGGRAFRIEQISGGYRLMTLPKFATTVSGLLKSRQHAKLSRAAIETLAIVAYRQPITRAELESIRGVACGEVLKGLMEKRLVTITGRAEEVGRPLLYGTTKQFLDAFGLSSVRDLPSVQDGG